MALLEAYGTERATAAGAATVGASHGDSRTAPSATPATPGDPGQTRSGRRIDSAPPSMKIT